MNIIITDTEILMTEDDSDLGKLVREKYHNLSRTKYDDLNKKKYDKCVICLKDSPYTSDTPIDNRIGYVEGGGQGCFMGFRCRVY